MMDPSKKYHIWYVADPTIPRNCEASEDNQRSKSFRFWIGMIWGCLTDPEIRASLKADRIRMMVIK